MAVDDDIRYWTGELKVIRDELAHQQCKKRNVQKILEELYSIQATGQVTVMVPGPGPRELESSPFLHGGDMT